MQRLQAFKFELMPNGEQQRGMRRFAGSCRFVFNKALAMQQAQHADGKKKLSYADLCKQLTIWRNSLETGWLSETHSQPLQQCSGLIETDTLIGGTYPIIRRKRCHGQDGISHPNSDSRLPGWSLIKAGAGSERV